MSQPNHFITNAKNYVKTVAREVRDIPTAVATAANSNPKYDDKNARNIGEQVTDVAKAVVTGKKGSSSNRWTKEPKMHKGRAVYGTDEERYVEGEKRR